MRWPEGLPFAAGQRSLTSSSSGSPTAPLAAHARHVAVEFVHPVILGKRALPSVAINVQDPVASLRSIVRSGDLVLVIGTADDESIIDALRRAPAWGVRTIWLGYGAPPDEHLADFSLWLPSADATAPYDGSLVYRLFGRPSSIGTNTNLSNITKHPDEKHQGFVWQK